MMVTCQVFGARAGRFAALEAQRKGRPRIPTGWAEKEKRLLFGQIARQVNVGELKRVLQDEAQEKLLVRRDEAGLRGFLDIVGDLRKGIEESTPGSPCREVWELLSLLRAGELMATAAILRKESRGSHFRSDFPTRDDARFGRPLVIRRGFLETVPRHLS